MKVSLNWLREFVELPDDVPALCELLTLAGVEVEGIETRGVTSDDVVVARVAASEPHPNADRLSVCSVEDGSGQPRQIVCGAKNYKVGDRVPLALPGAVLPGDFKIKVGKLRGVESQGMLCSAKELNLADDAAGLMILPEEAEVGTRLRDLYPAETVMEVEVTPNRPDLLSHIGMAREIAALSRRMLNVPAVEPLPDESPGGVRLSLEAGQDCPFYTARKITGVKVGPSPEWLRARIEAAGLRPVNNVVDVTNFVMLEMGQPLHAFDAAKVTGGISVRHASEGETFLALDGGRYSLKAAHMVIADERQAIAIAGVMGGEETGVVEETADVILESAWFRPGSVRRTSRELGLMSDSSYRFERGVDPAGVDRASLRAARLIAGIADGRVVTHDAAGEAPGHAKARSEGLSPGYVGLVPLRAGRCSEVAGGEVPEAEAMEILSRLGLLRKGDAWQIPSFRPDLVREIDLIEEVIRVFGIENIPARVEGAYVPATAADAVHDRCAALREHLAATGFYEARNVSLISAEMARHDPLGTDELRPLKNPMSEDQTILRPNLLPGLLQVLAHNLRAGEKRLSFFEIGRVFRAAEREERLHLALVMTGPARARSWRGGEREAADYFDLKGVLESLGLGALSFESRKNGALPLAADICDGGKVIGRIGQLAPVRARELDATAAVLLAEIDLGSLAGQAVRGHREVVRFPAVTRDIAIVAPLSTSHAVIQEAISSVNEPLLERAELFDVFTDPAGEKIPADRKSLAYSLIYRAGDRTLTAEEAGSAHARIKERLKAVAGVEFRE